MAEKMNWLGLRDELHWLSSRVVSRCYETGEIAFSVLLARQLITRTLPLAAHARLWKM